MVPAEPVEIEVVYSAGPGHTELVRLQLASGSSLADAVQASGLMSRYGLQHEQLSVGIWGRVKDISTILRERDRVEIYRVLLVDPKEARRQRYRKDRPRVTARTAKAGSTG